MLNPLIARIDAHLRQLAPHMLEREGVVLLRESMIEIVRLREIFRANITRLAPEVSHEEIDRVLDGADTPGRPNFDDRIDLRIEAAKLRLRVQVEILGNRAQRDLDLFAHQKFNELRLYINHGYSHERI